MTASRNAVTSAVWIADPQNSQLCKRATNVDPEI